MPEMREVQAMTSPTAEEWVGVIQADREAADEICDYFIVVWRMAGLETEIGAPLRKQIAELMKKHRIAQSIRALAGGD